MQLIPNLHIQRDDLIHPVYGGNKWRKLKYNFRYMQEQGITEIVTFGGPFSNHIYAVAGLCEEYGIHATAFIRGGVDDQHNPVLKAASSSGVELVALPRTEFARRNDTDFLDALRSSHPNAHVVPEGGTNSLSIPGCAEIVADVEMELGFLPEFWIVPGGTGGTAAGIADGLRGRAQVIVITALKKELFETTFRVALEWAPNADQSRIRIDDRFHFGGLAKWNDNLVECMRAVEKEHSFKLDPLYTAKAWYGMEKLLESGEIPSGASILFLHTGGQAGRACFNYRYGTAL